MSVPKLVLKKITPIINREQKEELDAGLVKGGFTVKEPKSSIADCTDSHMLSIAAMCPNRNVGM